VADLFVAEQVAFLRDCAGVGVNLRTLTVLPPVDAFRWKKIQPAVPDLEVRAERWTVGELDFLELSAVAPVDEAPAVQEALTAHLTDQGLAVPADQAPKTSQVLDLLVRQALDRS
jgi:hypothetical protein